MWPIELHLEDYSTGVMRIVVLEPVTDTMLLQLVQCQARFTLNGVRYSSVSDPIADMDRRVIIYRCAGSS
jgi:hypothetical protein